MSETSDPLIQECAACGALIDVSDEEPLALMHCPTCGNAMRVQRMFGQFEILEVLGAGGMGAVYRAQDTSLNRTVALKLLRREYTDQPDFIQQFEHEAAITAQINNPFVVKVYSTGSDHGLFYIAMELVDKGSLDDLMTLQGRVGEVQVLEVGIQTAQGLHAAFQQGLIHRDVKPGNILFAGAHHAKIVDFGLAVPIGDGSGMAGEVWGTPYYVAPEKLDNPPQEDFRSDIYSLGATLFHAAAGRPPYEAEDASIVALKHLKSQSVSLQAFAPDISSATAYVINRALHKDPAQRYQSYEELIQHLEYARQQLLAKPVKVRVAKPRVVMHDAGSQKATSFMTLFMLLVLAAGVYFVYQQRDRLFPHATVTKVALPAKNVPSKYKAAYEDARRLLINGKPEEAAAAFRKIEGEPDATHPMVEWANFHAGLATIVAGKLDDARADFERLSKRGPFSENPVDQQISEFLGKISKLAMEEAPQPPEVAQEYRKDDFQAIALLLFAVKDWELGEFDSALALFRQFDSSTPEEPYQWIADYKGLATAYVDTYARFKAFAEEAGNAGEPAKAKEKLPKLKESLAALNLKGTLAKKGRAMVRKVEQEIGEAEAEQHKAVAEMEESDAKSLEGVKAKTDELVKAFKFKEALVLAKGAEAITEKGKKDKEGLIKKMDWLVGFKAQLTQDLGVTPYPGGVARKVGIPLAGQVIDADEATLQVKVQATTIPIAWTDASFEGLFNMARSYLQPNLPADRLADRMWFLGVFADVSGKTKEAGALFAQAVKNKPSYEEEWKLFPEVPKPGA